MIRRLALAIAVALACAASAQAQSNRGLLAPGQGIFNYTATAKAIGSPQNWMFANNGAPAGGSLSLFQDWVDTSGLGVNANTRKIFDGTSSLPWMTVDRTNHIVGGLVGGAGTQYVGSSGSPVNFTGAGTFYWSATSPNVYALTPGFDGGLTQFSEANNIAVTWASASQQKGAALSVQAIVAPSAAGSPGAGGALVGGVYNRLTGNDAYAVLGYVGNSTEPTDSKGAGVWGIARVVGGQGNTTVDAVRGTSETLPPAAGSCTGTLSGTSLTCSTTFTGAAIGDMVLDANATIGVFTLTITACPGGGCGVSGVYTISAAGPTISTPETFFAFAPDHPRSGLLVSNSTAVNAFGAGVVVASALNAGVQVGLSSTQSSNWGGAALGTSTPTHPFSFFDASFNEDFFVDSTGRISASSASPGHSFSSSSVSSAIATFAQGGSSNAAARVIVNHTVAGKQALIEYQDSGTDKWFEGKDTDNSWIVFDAITTKNVIRAPSNSSGQTFFGGTLTVNGVTGVGTAQTDGLVVSNSTAAANNAPQDSPVFRLTGNGWSTGATVSHQVDWIFQNRPIQVTSGETLSKLTVSVQTNAGGYTDVGFWGSGGGPGAGLYTANVYGGVHNTDGLLLQGSNTSGPGGGGSSPTGDTVTIATGGAGSRIKVLSNGNIGFGTETNPQGLFVVSNNATPGFSNASGIFNVLGPDSATATFKIFGFSSNSGAAANGTAFAMLSARNTAGSQPSASSALLATDLVALWTFAGYGSDSAYHNVAKILVSAVDNITSTTLGSQMQFQTAAAGSSTVQNAMLLKAGVIIGANSTTDPGNGSATLSVGSGTNTLRLENTGSGSVTTQLQFAATAVANATAALVYNENSGTPFFNFTNGTGNTGNYFDIVGPFQVRDGANISNIRFTVVQTGGVNVGGSSDPGAGSITVNSHYRSSGSAPAVSACGSTPSPSITGTDAAGKITVGGGTVTSCTVTFAATYGTAPACTISASTALTSPAVSTTATVLTITAGATFNGDVIAYHCTGQAYLMLRDLDPASNDNSPAFLALAA